MRKDIMKYYFHVDYVWTTKDDHCVYLECYDEDENLIKDYTFYYLEDFFEAENDDVNEYHSISVKFDPITFQFPRQRISDALPSSNNFMEALKKLSEK
jgi:hypothetical protein